MRLFASLISIAAVLVFAGCGASQNFPPGVEYPAPATAPPLNLCPTAVSVPKDLSAKPGFALLRVNVTDASHQPMKELKQADFEAYANAAAFPIAYFHPDNGAAPESIALVIDTSGSMHPKLPVVEKALADFLVKLNACDEVSIYAFSDNLYPLTRPTTDHQLAASSLSKLQAFGETSLYDSIAKVLAAQRHADYPNRAIVLITDGVDNDSIADQKADTVAKVRNSGVRMFLIGIGDPNASGEPSIAIGSIVLNGGGIDRVDAKAINSFADATGGEAFIVPTVNDKDKSGAFAKAVASIGSVLGQGYTLGIVLPPGIDAASVTVAIPSHPDAIVTTRVVPAAQSPGP